MGEIKKADYLVDNGTDYDKIHFSTGADQVEYVKSGGQTTSIQEALGGYSLRIVDVRPDVQEPGVIYFIRKAEG
ncbi:MAG: hypothetical protein HFI38_02425 [Lachnospiraceae bacterium]|jgi:hypothetical protein|nr:hypothetical protein [Lachnospiraceae bacterium]